MSDKLLSKEADSALLAFFILYDIFVCLGSVLILIRRNKTPISQRGWVVSFPYFYFSFNFSLFENQTKIIIYKSFQ